jgi:hypothetical protein
MLRYAAAMGAYDVGPILGLFHKVCLADKPHRLMLCYLTNADTPDAMPEVWCS